MVLVISRQIPVARSARVRASSVQRSKRDEDSQMLTCGGCRVARFCSADHQKMASKSGASVGSLLEGRHKDVCGVLGKWKQQVVKDGMSADSCRKDLLAFLQQ